MTTPSIFEAVGINVQIEEPLWYSYSHTNWRYNNAIESYSHVNSAESGYESCQFSVKIALDEADDWLEKGLARHVEIYSASGKMIWEGFVNKVSFGAGTLSAARGPLFDIGNRIMVVYTPIIDATVDPMVTGSATETPIAEDTDSQDRYGIIEKVISGGQLLDDGVTDEAEEIRDLSIVEMAWPYTDEEINLSGGNIPTLTLECLGYKKWLATYVYNYYTATTVTLDTKIKDVLDADPNSVFSTNQSYIEANAQLTNKLEDQNRFAESIIQEITAMGDGSDNRWLFQVLDGRICHYKAIPTSVEYAHTITSRSSEVTLIDGTGVDPWDMPAGVWVEITDFMIGQSAQSPMHKDPRNVFAERVTYTAPYGLSITGARISTVKQRLAQLGVGGG